MIFNKDLELGLGGIGRGHNFFQIIDKIFKPFFLNLEEDGFLVFKVIIGGGKAHAGSPRNFTHRGLFVPFKREDLRAFAQDISVGAV